MESEAEEAAVCEQPIEIIRDGKKVLRGIQQVIIAGVQELNARKKIMKQAQWKEIAVCKSYHYENL